MNLQIERNPIGIQEDKTPLYDLRVIVDNRELRPLTDEQREAVLMVCEAFDPPAGLPKPDPK